MGGGGGVVEGGSKCLLYSSKKASFSGSCSRFQIFCCEEYDAELPKIKETSL